jgi:hypothetical protein
MLAKFFLRIDAEAGEKTLELRVAGEAADKVIGDGGNGIVGPDRAARGLGDE